jgi:hypothetical protein
MQDSKLHCIAMHDFDARNTVSIRCAIQYSICTKNRFIYAVAKINARLRCNDNGLMSRANQCLIAMQDSSLMCDNQCLISNRILGIIAMQETRFDVVVRIKD